MKKIQYSKIIMTILVCFDIAVTVFLCAVMWRTGDTSPAPYVTLGAAGPVAVWLAGYAYKERSANNLKIAFSAIKEIQDTDAAIRIAEIVLQQ